MHGFRDNKVLLQAIYDVIVISPRVLHAILYDRFWKSDHDFLMAFRSNFLPVMHGFWDNKMLSQAGYDVIVISLWVLYAILYDWFWKSDYDFPMAFRTNFLSGMHGFRDNEVLLQVRYNIIVISPLGGASRYFTWCIMKKRP